MTEEERVAATEEEMAAIYERREGKEVGTWHNADIVASHDTSMTVSRVKEEVRLCKNQTLPSTDLPAF